MDRQKQTRRRRRTAHGEENLLDDREWNKSSSRASEALLEAGIPGIKYLDATSRAAGEGTRNYVVFDDGLLEITHKNGVEVERPIPLVDHLVGELQAELKPAMTAAGVAEDNFSAGLQRRAARYMTNGTPASSAVERGRSEARQRRTSMRFMAAQHREMAARLRARAQREPDKAESYLTQAKDFDLLAKLAAHEEAQRRVRRRWPTASRKCGPRTSTFWRSWRRTRKRNAGRRRRWPTAMSPQLRLSSKPPSSKERRLRDYRM